ncbi:MAG: hypothetical protein M3164_06545 [Actinomycetota bacterium]|nr:hypothetical protein [Actinomycetota bacterium]
MPPARGTEPDYSERIDALLSSALAEQSREKRFLTEVVYGAKSALLKAQEELQAMRQIIAKRDQAIMDLLRSRLEGVETQSISTRLDSIERAIGDPEQSVFELLESRLAAAGIKDISERIEAMEEAILQLASVMSELPDQFKAELESSSSSVRERMAEETAEVAKTVRSLIEGLLTDLREDAVEVVETLRVLAESVLTEMRNALEASRTEMRDTLEASRKQSLELIRRSSREVNETTRATAEAVVEHLVAYLAQRDERIQRARDQALVELFQQLAENVSRRDRRKIAKAASESPSFGLSSLSQPMQPPPALQPFTEVESPVFEREDPAAAFRASAPVSARLLDDDSSDSGPSESEDVSEYLRVPPATARRATRARRPPSEEAPQPDDGKRGRKAASGKAESRVKSTGPASARGAAVRSPKKGKTPEPGGEGGGEATAVSGPSPMERGGQPVTYRGGKALGE